MQLFANPPVNVTVLQQAPKTKVLRILHLTASTFLGGPERQMLDLARSLSSNFQTVFTSFHENGLCTAFLKTAREYGFQTAVVKKDRPRMIAAWREISDLLRKFKINVLCSHGYKANFLGLLAARRLRIPAVAVSRGWTGETFRVKLYEALDRLVLPWMDRVICVSNAQRHKACISGVPEDKTRVIYNAIRAERFAEPSIEYRNGIQNLFPKRRSVIVGAAGRLSPEKGFDVLVKAASAVTKKIPEAGFVLFGEGRMRDDLARLICELKLENHFILAGFRSDLDQFIPSLDLLVLPSHTEGLPNVVLEAMAAGVAVLSTRVGGTPELIEDGYSGYLVSPGDHMAMAQMIKDILDNSSDRKKIGINARKRVVSHFSFANQAKAYEDLFRSLGNPAHTTPRH